jgi:hypothetical protein
MGHDMRNFIGVSRADLAKAVGKLAPDAMAMGSTGMGDGQHGDAGAGQTVGCNFSSRGEAEGRVDKSVNRDR